MRKRQLAMIASVAAVATVSVGAGIEGRGPFGVVFCSEKVTAYVQAPIPAPLLTDAPVMAVGDRRAVGWAGTTPSDRGPRFIGDASLFATEVVVFPMRQRCDFVADGYKFTVLQALAPGRLVVKEPNGNTDLTIEVSIVARAAR